MCTRMHVCMDAYMYACVYHIDYTHTYESGAIGALDSVPGTQDPCLLLGLCAWGPNHPSVSSAGSVTQGHDCSCVSWLLTGAALLVRPAQDDSDADVWAFQRHRRTFHLAQPYTGMGEEPNRSASMPPPAPLPLSYTQQTACFKAGGRRRASISGKAPRVGLRGLVTYSPPLLRSIQVSPLISPPWISDHPLCSAPGQATLLPELFLACSPSPMSTKQPRMWTSSAKTGEVLSKAG